MKALKFLKGKWKEIAIVVLLLNLLVGTGIPALADAIRVQAQPTLDDISDVNVPTPADDDLLAWDNGASEWVDIAHIDLDTGVHDVGSDHVAVTSVDGLDLAGHSTRHEIGGADALSNVFLADIVRAANFQMIPTAGGWSTHTDALPSGVVSQSPFRMLVYVNGVGANAFAEAYTQSYGFNEGGTYQFINWDEELWFIFSYARYRSEADLKCWIQISESSSTSADLTTEGIGLVVKNLDLFGEAYGTSREEVDLNTALTSQLQCQVAINLKSTGVCFYINGVLKGTIDTSGKYPTGLSAAIWMQHSMHDMGTQTGGLTASSMMAGKLWQER